MAENIKFPPRVVIDALVALAFLLPDERQTEVDFLFRNFSEGKVKILVPEIFNFEVFNGLRSAILRKRINVSLAKRLVKSFLRFQIQKREVNCLLTFNLALKKKISFYDASYLALSQTKKIPLLTLDKMLLGRK